jgi:DNA-binding NtrC family response regulator
LISLAKGTPYVISVCPDDRNAVLVEFDKLQIQEIEMADDKQTIIIVDDEEMVLTSLDSILNLETTYHVRTFTSAKAALEFAASNDFDLVVSDYLMPEMDGISFLAEVKKIRPEVPRIILTGYADKENAIKAINDVGLYQYIEKPWSNDDLLIILRNGLEKQRLMKKLQRKIDEINQAYGELEGLHREIVRTFV